MDREELKKMDTASLLELRRLTNAVLVARETGSRSTTESEWIEERRATDSGYFQLEKIKCGNPRCRKCADGTPSHPPHWYEYSYTDDGKLKRRHVGRELKV